MLRMMWRFDLAAEKGHTETVKLLLDRGAEDLMP